MEKQAFAETTVLQPCWRPLDLHYLLLFEVELFVYKNMDSITKFLKVLCIWKFWQENDASQKGKTDVRQVIDFL